MESISSNVSGGMNLQKADGADNTPFKKISLSKSDYRKLFSGLKSEIRDEKIDIRKAKSGSGVVNFLGKCWHWVTSLLFVNSECDLQSEIRKEYGFDIANALPEGKVSSGELERIKDILDRKIESFETKTGRVFHRAKNGKPAYWEESLSVRLDKSEQRDDKFLEALRKAGDNEGLQVLTGFDIIRVIEGEEGENFKGYYYKNIKIYPKVVDGVLDKGKATVVLKRFSHSKQVHETLKLDIPRSSLPESVKTKLSGVWSTRQKILSKRGPLGLFAILQETDEVDGNMNERINTILMNYKENPEWLLRDIASKVQVVIFTAGARQYLSGVIGEKNNFPETPQERKKLVNEVFSELKTTGSKIFNEDFSDEEIKQLIDMEISRNNLENGKSLCDNDFMYVAAELQRPVLLQVGTEDDPSYIFFPPTKKSDHTISGTNRNAFKALQNSVRRFSKSELQDELCKDTEFLESFKDAIFAEKVDDGRYINAGQDLINSCQNMIAVGDVEAEKRAEAARKAEEARKAEKEAEAKAKALPPHVKLTDAEWKDPAFRRVLEDAVKIKGLSVEGFLKKIVSLSKDGIRKGYSLEDIRIYPDLKDSKGAIIVMERFSTSKGKNETLELNVPRDALPKSIQSKLKKLNLSAGQELVNSAAGDVEAGKRAEATRKAKKAKETSGVSRSKGPKFSIPNGLKDTLEDYGFDEKNLPQCFRDLINRTSDTRRLNKAMMEVIGLMCQNFGYEVDVERCIGSLGYKFGENVDKNISSQELNNLESAANNAPDAYGKKINISNGKIQIISPDGMSETCSWDEVMVYPKTELHGYSRITPNYESNEVEIRFGKKRFTIPRNSLPGSVRAKFGNPFILHSDILEQEIEKIQP